MSIAVASGKSLGIVAVNFIPLVGAGYLFGRACMRIRGEKAPSSQTERNSRRMAAIIAAIASVALALGVHYLINRSNYLPTFEQVWRAEFPTDPNTRNEKILTFVYSQFANLYYFSPAAYIGGFYFGLGGTLHGLFYKEKSSSTYPPQITDPASSEIFR